MRGDGQILVSAQKQPIEASWIICIDTFIWTDPRALQMVFRETWKMPSLHKNYKTWAFY